MSWRSELEDRHTVKCRSCGHEMIDPSRKPNQKYSNEKCPACGHNPKEKR